jgi:hypothetical protein
MFRVDGTTIKMYFSLGSEKSLFVNYLTKQMLQIFIINQKVTVSQITFNESW